MTSTEPPPAPTAVPMPAGGTGGIDTSNMGGAAGLGGTSANGGSGDDGGRSGSGGGGGVASGGAGEPFAAPFWLGADISSVQEAVDTGAVYVDTDGTSKPMLALLKAHGFNAVRLRTFVDPGTDYGYSSCGQGGAYCDTAHNVEFGREIKQAGMGYLLDFHYSDTWADPGKQVIPEAWRDAQSIMELAAYVRDYTAATMTQMVDGGARPDWVQVGNEITPGMLIHTPTPQTDCYGNNSQLNPSGVTGSASNWDNLATLIKAGIEGVKVVDANIPIMLHVENTDDLAGVRNWVNNALSRGVEFEILGLSCYTAFQGQPSTWRDTFMSLADEFPELSFVVAEYNPERTAANQIMLDLPDGRGLGTFFWEPAQSGSWGESMFSRSGNTYTANQSAFSEYDALSALIFAEQKRQ